MGSYYRQMRRRDELHLMTTDGVIVVRISTGRPELHVDAPREIKIAHKKRRNRLVPIDLRKSGKIGPK